MTSTAGDAALTVRDPSATAPGHLVNGTNVLPQALKVNGSALADASDPTRLATWTAPVSNGPVTVHLLQSDPLRTGDYAKTLTFTLSTTTP